MDLDQAAKAAGLRSLVKRPSGYEARKGAGGAVLSGAEQQLIAPARVRLSAARVVILDEGASQLDPIAQAQAQEAFRERDGTPIIIARRISSTMRANQVLILDGRSTVDGTRRTLMIASPLCREPAGSWTGSDADRTPRQNAAMRSHTGHHS
ncbi:hypothetical protein ABZ471_36190 [Streptomyces sp. NPDC005728]|uniref:hypothetical protein n=1 Tax=Streptomyces sp. NPDC005728 TaxID=3157054 RepID=UPI00340E5F94